MKKKTNLEREIYVVGRPSLENLSKSELKIFYSTLLSCAVEYYKGKSANEAAFLPESSFSSVEPDNR